MLLSVGACPEPVEGRSRSPSVGNASRDGDPVAPGRGMLGYGRSSALSRPARNAAPRRRGEACRIAVAPCKCAHNDLGLASRKRYLRSAEGDSYPQLFVTVLWSAVGHRTALRSCKTWSIPHIPISLKACHGTAGGWVMISIARTACRAGKRRWISRRDAPGETAIGSRVLLRPGYVFDWNSRWHTVANEREAPGGDASEVGARGPRFVVTKLLQRSNPALTLST